MKKAIGKTIGQLVLASAFLLAVWAVAYVWVGNELVLPSFFDCFAACGAFLRSAAFWQAFSGTFLRVAEAFVYSFVLALVFAIIAYLLPAFAGFFAPIVGVMRSLPVLAVLLIVLTWTTAGRAPVAVAFLSLFPMLYAETYAALLGVDKGLTDMSKVYRVPIYKRVTQLYLPAVAPTLARTSGAAFAFSLKLVVSAEVLVRTAKSLGSMMQESQLYSQTAETFALVILACAAGIIVESAFALLSKILRGRISGHED